MRNVPYSERIRNFVETNLQIYNIQRNGNVGNDITPPPSLYDPLNGRRLSEDLQEITVSDLTNIWSDTVRGYLQNIGLDSIEPQNGFLDGIRMYHTRMPVFGIAPPVSYRTPEEIRTGIYPQYTFSLDPQAFDTKQHLIDYLIANLVQGREIFLYSVEKSPLVYHPMDFQPTRRWIARLKVIDWATKLNRTDFSFLKVKKDFTPTKIIPKFTM